MSDVLASICTSREAQNLRGRRCISSRLIVQFFGASCDGFWSSRVSLKFDGCRHPTAAFINQFLSHTATVENGDFTGIIAILRQPLDSYHLFHSWMILPELLGRRAEIAEMVDGRPSYLKAEGVEWFGFHPLDKIFVGDTQRDVRYIFRAAGVGDEMLDPADGVGIGVVAHESGRGAA